MTAAAQPTPDLPAEAVDLLALQRRERALDAVWPWTDTLIAAVHSRRQHPGPAAAAVAAALTGARAVPAPDGIDPLDLLALALADRCAGYMLALGMMP